MSGRDGPLAAPRTPQGKALLQRLEARGHDADILYLPPGAPLDAVVAPLGPDARATQPTGDATVQLLVLAVVAGAIALAALWAWRRGLLTGQGPDRFAARRAHAPDFMKGAHTALDAEALLALDPREGMRRLLAGALAQAARETGTVSRRAFTSRDILAGVPRCWREHERLARLVAAAEPVVFGGRPIDRATLAAHLADAGPILKGRR